MKIRDSFFVIGLLLGTCGVLQSAQAEDDDSFGLAEFNDEVDVLCAQVAEAEIAAGEATVLAAQAELVRPQLLSAEERNLLNNELLQTVYEGREGVVARVQHLIARGADVTAPDRDGWIPLHLHCVVYQKCFPELIEVLIKANPGSVHYRTTYRSTPLHIAALSVSGLGAVAALITAGANPNSQDNCGRTPLHRAFRGSSRNEEIVYALVDAGADPDIPNNDGKTSRQLARERGLEDWLRGDTKPARAIPLE